MFPPRREKCAEDVPAELWGGAADLPSGRGLSGGLHRTEEGLRDLLLFHILPLPRYILCQIPLQISEVSLKKETV